MIPERVAIRLQEDGWILRNKCIWNKPNHMPSSVKDRLTNSWEYVFFFVKSRKYFFDLDAIRQPHVNSTFERAKYPRGGKRHELISDKESFNRRLSNLPMTPNLLGKNPSDTLQYESKYETNQYGQPLQGFIRTQSIVKERQQSRLDAEKLFPNDKKKQQEYINYIHDHSGNALGKNPSDFWTITTQPFKGAHFAVYPERLVELPIKATCPQWICSKCGMPRTRITQVSGRIVTESMKIAGCDENGEYFGEATKDYESSMAQNPSDAKRRILRSMSEVKETVGWSDCGCNAGWENGVVLDPMCGSGTTLLVARKLLRHYVGVELNPEYVRIAEKRLAKVPRRLDTA